MLISKKDRYYLKKCGEPKVEPTKKKVVKKKVVKKKVPLFKPLPGEIFKKHPLYTKYQFSNMGRAISNNTSNTHLLKPTQWLPEKYYAIIINPGHTRVHMHVLICETFHGTRPEGKFASGRPHYQVSHKDNNYTNNNPDNLEWATVKDNLRNNLADRTYEYLQGPQNVYTEEDVVEWIEMRKDGKSYNDIAKISGASSVTVSSRIKNFGNSQHIKRRRYTTEQQKDWIKQYQTGTSISAIAKKVKASWATVKNYIDKKVPEQGPISENKKDIEKNPWTF